MKNFKNLIVICLVTFIFLACKEELPGPLSTGDDTPPGLVQNVTVENLPGGAKIKYVLPASKNLLYVKAVYEFPKGNFREVISSAYGDSLSIEGIGKTDELEVKLFSVNRAEKSSEPVSVKINPLTPPVQITGASLTLNETFGGVNVTFQNATKSNIVVTIIRKDGDEWVPIETMYTNQQAGAFAARNQVADVREFGVFVKDRWNNRSDTLKAELEPLFEEELPEPTAVLSLPGDYNYWYQSFSHKYMFDGIKVNANYYGTLLNSPVSKLPLSFTLDYKKPVSFSRLKLWNRHKYANGAVENFEVWGSNELEDDWSKWTKIMDCVVKKPSGSPLGVNTSEDLTVADAGFDFDFPIGTPRYRYIRWKSTKNFGTVDYIQITELTFWGSQK